MDEFLRRFGAKVIGVLHGFDRLRFRGSKRGLCCAQGMLGFMWQVQILLKDFGAFAEDTTNTLCRAIETRAREMELPTIYLAGSTQSKEKRALCDNCFTPVGDFAKAQQLLDAQVQMDWSTVLEELAARSNPLHTKLLQPAQPYYWSVEASEWATDILFRSRADLAKLYPIFVRHDLRCDEPIHASAMSTIIEWPATG